MKFTTQQRLHRHGSNALAQPRRQLDAMLAEKANTVACLERRGGNDRLLSGRQRVRVDDRSLPDRVVREIERGRSLDHEAKRSRSTSVWQDQPQPVIASFVRRRIKLPAEWIGRARERSAAFSDEPALKPRKPQQFAEQIGRSLFAIRHRRTVTVAGARVEKVRKQCGFVRQCTRRQIRQLPKSSRFHRLELPLASARFDDRFTGTKAQA